MASQIRDRIAVIGTVGIPSSYGGFETLVEHLCDGNHRFDVYCSTYAYTHRLDNYKGAKLWYVPLRANGAQSILYDVYSMIHAVIKGYRNLLILGVSGAIFFPFLMLVMPSIRIVTNIDGLEWKREKWSRLQKCFLKFSEYLAVKFSSTVIADNRAIVTYVLAQYSVNAHLIPYGGDHCVPKNVNLSAEETAFLVCRIEPENSIHLILDAFSRVATKIIIVGNWNSSQYGIDLRTKYSLYNNIELRDPVYDQILLDESRSSCTFYVHGHTAGGTNPSLVEIMHFAKPVIAYDCVYNRETLQNIGQYFKTSDDLVNILKNKTWMAVDTLAIKKIAIKYYTWARIKSEYSALFHIT